MALVICMRTHMRTHMRQTAQTGEKRESSRSENGRRVLFVRHVPRARSLLIHRMQSARWVDDAICMCVLFVLVRLSQQSRSLRSDAVIRPALTEAFTFRTHDVVKWKLHYSYRVVACFLLCVVPSVLSCRCPVRKVIFIQVFERARGVQ